MLYKVNQCMGNRCFTRAHALFRIIFKLQGWILKLMKINSQTHTEELICIARLAAEIYISLYKFWCKLIILENESSCY